VKSKVPIKGVKGEKTTADIGREFGVHPMQVSILKRILLKNLDLSTEWTRLLVEREHKHLSVIRQ
jgi:hypothetical protein